MRGGRAGASKNSRDGVSNVGDERRDEHEADSLISCRASNRDDGSAVVVPHKQDRPLHRCQRPGQVLGVGKESAKGDRPDEHRDATSFELLDHQPPIGRVLERTVHEHDRCRGGTIDQAAPPVLPALLKSPHPQRVRLDWRRRVRRMTYGFAWMTYDINGPTNRRDGRAVARVYITSFYGSELIASTLMHSTGR